MYFPSDVSDLQAVLSFLLTAVFGIGTMGLIFIIVLNIGER